MSLDHGAELKPLNSQVISATADTRIAYFTGHFPLETHTFFWREIQALESCGCDVTVISTRRPRAMGSEWQKQAADRTQYLVPFNFRAARECMLGWMRSGVSGWIRALRTCAQGENGLRGRLGQLLLLPLAARLVYWQRGQHWSHIHVGFAEQAANIAMLANRLAGVSYSISLGHSIYDSGPNQRQKWSHAAFGVAISQFLADEVPKFFDGRTFAAIYVARRGIPVERFTRPSPYRPWAPGNVARLFSCARITPNKGHEAIIRAIAIVRQRHGVRVSLRLAGGDTSADGTFTKHLQTIAHSLDLSDSIEFIGSRNQSEVIKELHQAHIAVIGSSREYKEGWGNAIAEAVASGTPTIACRTGGVPETIQDGFNGLLAVPGDPESMAECISRLLLDPKLATAFASEGPNSIAQNFPPSGGASVLLSAMAQAGRVKLN